MTYGANGAAGTETSYGAAGGDNTGCGGQGGYYQSGNGGNGGSGIVVIKITALNELKDVTVETAPEEVTAKSGTTLGTISLTDGKAVDANGVEVPGKFAFADATYALKVTDDGKSFDVVFMPTDGATYKTATCQVVVTATATAKSAIEAVGASTTGTDDQPIYSFTTTTGTKTLTIPEGYKATVQLLVVGGGGGGGYANNTSTRYGNGGDGGQVLGGNNSTITRTVGAGETLNITVGAGGTAGTAAQGGNTNAQPGGYSSVTGGNSFGAEVKANGGSAGGNTQSSTNAKNGTGAGATAGSGTVTGIQSNLRTGSNVTYGEGGAKGSNSNPSAGGDNTGKGGGGARATSSNSSRRNGAAGGSGIVVIKVTSFEALPKEPVVESLSVTPVKRGDALSTSAITLTMGDPKTHANVPGDYDWKAPATVVSAPGEYPIVFTPTKAGYAEVEVMAQVSVIAPQEDDAEEVIDNGTSVAVTTTSFGGDWSATVVSGASYIETPELTVNDDDTATVTIKGKAIGTAVIDLYDGATWVKRITVAVMAPPIERTVELTMDIDDAAETVQTTTTATYWGNTIVSGADFVTATTAKSSGTGARIATTTITPKAYGTAVIEVRSGTSQAQLNTLVQRIIVTVAPPTEGSQTITVAQNASKVVKTASEIDSYEKVMTEGAASISSVTVGDREATIVASGTIGTAKVKLYKGDTLVKVVTVNVVDPTHTILTLCYAEVMEFTLTNATSVSWSATATDNVRLMTAATTAATSQNGSGASFTIKICGYTANGSGTVTVKQGQNTVMTYDCTVLADIAEDTTDGYNSIQSGKKSLSVYIGEPLNLSYYRQSATKWRFVDAEITSAMFTDRSKYTYKELGVFKATTSKGYTYSKGESGTASTSANLTSATSSDFDVKLEGVKTGTGPLAICFGSNQPSHYAGYYDVTVWKPIAKPAATLSFTYDGEAKAPVASGDGYTVSGDATKTAAGTYTAIVMLDEYYCWPDHSTDPLVVEWTIEPAEITSATAANQTYTGSALTPELTVKAGGLDATYDLGAWNPDGLTDAGTYTATVTGKGNFTGSATVTFTINPKAVTVYPIATNKVYGAADPTIKYTVDPALVSGDELEGALARSAGEDVGAYDVLIGTLTNSNYKITLDATAVANAFTITQAKENVMTGKPTQQGWQAGETPVPADLGDVSAEFGMPVAVYYLDETCENSFVPSTETTAGIYYVRAEVAETANYAGAVSDSVAFEVTAVPDVDLANCDVTFDPPEAPYWGGQISVAYTVIDPEGVTLTEGTHFTAEWDPATIQDAGEYTLTLTAVDGSGYTGMKTADFTVIQAANWINGEPAQQGWQAGETPVPADLDDVSAEFGTPVAVYYLDETCENSFVPSTETAAGIYYVRAEVAETANYAGAVSDSVAFEVTAAKVFTATFTKGEGVDSFTVAIDGAAAVAYTAPLTDLTNGTEIVLAVTPAAGYKYLGETMFTVNGADISETIAATEIVMTVNGVTYTTVEEALAALESEGGTALFNKASSIYEVFTFEKDTTLTVADGAWFVTNNLTLAATTVTNDISVSEKLTLAGNVTVGSDDYEATLAFGSIDNNGGTYKLTLTTNGVVQSATQLDDAVFAEVEHFHVAKKTIAGGFEYTLEATEFYVKYYDGDEVVYSNKFTILNYMTDLHVWDGTRDGLVLIGYTREDKTTKLDATDSALRDYVKDEADDPGCDGEVKVFGTWEQKIIPVNVPTAVTGLTYNGNEQTGVVENVGYTLTNNAKTDAGDYTATATLANGYIWDDGSSDPTNINWSIAAAKLTSASAASQTWMGSKLIPVVVAKAGEVVATTADFDVGTWDPDGLTDVGKYTAKVTGKRNFTGEVDVEFEIIEQKQEVEPGKTTKVIPEKVPTTPEEIAAAEADALNKVKVVITDEEAKSAGQEDIVKEVAKYNSETKTVDVTLAIDTNSENYVEMDNAITDISTNLEDVVSGESSALKIPADEVTPGLYYNVIVEDENGNVTTGECALATSEGGVNLPVPEIDPNVTGLYFTVEQHLLKDGSDEGVVSKTLGYLGKEPTETEAIVRDFVGAPWGGMTDSEEIAVENFVKTENLKEGTKLYSYDEGKDAYNAWELDENKSWKPIKTYMMTDGKLTEQETKTADTAKIKRGKGAWIEHVKLDKKFVFVGDATRSEVAVPTTEGYNALSAKNFESLDLNDTLLEGASSKDSIIIPQAGSVPLVCTLKDGKWGYDSFTETEKKIGGQVQKVHTNTRVTNIKIPAGSAFWYVRGKTAK